ncbi:putative vomeronasal receptor-like protein 4 [Ochotona princeps]|uniref:putative vomeronasal receptor-like protein 4 n=1 Tax=Ochotona princeps TaxID=9978 RepID=UPI002714A1BF|nr:putative vomeronasal receptor-like protein 4 [Ochotona princeps]
MTWNNLTQRIICLSLTGPGIVGNFLMLLRCVHTLAVGPVKKSIDLILIHLAISNIVIICTTGIRDLITIIYISNLLGGIICKTVVYLNRVARSLSICTTCLLSVVQAITITPRNTLWRKFKPRTAWQVLPHLLCFWVFSFLISSNLLHYITAINSMNESSVRTYIGYCYMLPAPQMFRWLFLCLMALRDLTFQSLMSWSSGYMALYLYKHHKRILYLQSSKFAKYPSPEIRAMQSTLILMACFLFSYWIDFILSFYIGTTLKEYSTILNIKMFLELGYASLSPFVLISRDLCFSECWNSHQECRKVLLC